MSERFVIAGPCAAETEDQVLETARGVALCREKYPQFHFVFRAGIWKPRTSPDTFQGAGEKGLKWLQRVQEEMGLEVATEVANPGHARMAVAAGVDYLWIGARTAADPMAVQAIADSLKMEGGTWKGVMVKNPVNEDAALWMGNIERMEQTGLPVMAVHRGCDHRPCWQMAYQLKQQRPDIPLLIDPSHMAGKANAVAELCEKATELGYQGWMVETHVCPKQALSDAQQQVTPEELEAIVGSIKLKVESLKLKEEGLELVWLRSRIDEVDDDLWAMMAKRLDICREIGAWKKTRQVPVVQMARYQEILQKRIAWARDHGIEAEAVEQIMNAIHKESVSVQG